MNYKDRFDNYNLLDKEVLIGMLIEIDINRNNLSNLIEEYKDKPTTQAACNLYIPGTDTAMRCVNCGQNKYNHARY